MVANKDQKTVKLGVLRNKSTLTLTVELPAPVKHQDHHSPFRTNI
jgi:hypothetical protein